MSQQCLTGGGASPAFDAATDDAAVELISLFQAFLDQLVPIRAIVAVGCPTVTGVKIDDAVLLGVNADGSQISTRHALTWHDRDFAGVGSAYESLAHQARESSADLPGEDLLMLPERLLDAPATAFSEDFGFRAVVVLCSDNNGWKLQRRMFDIGLVYIGSLPFLGNEARCFLVSDAIRFPHRLMNGSRDRVTMSSLGRNGRFANQLFQYAFLRLYALRHGLTASAPNWEGRDLFDLQDQLCDGVALPRLSFGSFTNEDRLLWEGDDQPINVDLFGYFQEIPACWQKHRQLLRRMFELPFKHQGALDLWHRTLTSGGKRTLVAVHVRRGDYRFNGLPWFRLVPEEFYVHWLRAIWPTLAEPLLFVATDEPDEVLPRFEEFAPVPVTKSLRNLPEHVRDFEIMRRADCLAICNSSFSRMAAILAPSGQRCFLPSFQSKSFMPYQPWIDSAFWARFADDTGPYLPPKTHQQQYLRLARTEGALLSPSLQHSIYFDVSDLLLYLLDHPTLTGIQRVQCEIVRQLMTRAQPGPIHFVILQDGDGLGLIEASALLEVLELVSSVAAPRNDLDGKIRALSGRALPCALRNGDVFLTIGAFWAVSGMGRLLQRLKNSGAVVGIFVHDILPISDPEFFQTHDNKVFTKAVVEAFSFADFVLTSSSYNKASLASHLTGRRAKRPVIDIVPLAHRLPKSPASGSAISEAVSDLINGEFVLCAGTIEVRKNPIYLFQIWKLMLQSGRANIPKLVFAGRSGWLVRDFIGQLEACDYLGGRVVILRNVSDVELDLLYRKCLLTVFPSFAEGWGLPVGESLGYGKVTLCAATGAIAEVAGECADYLDPYSARNGLQSLLRFLDDPDLRRRREDEIAACFRARPWEQVADALLKSIRSLAQQIESSENIAAMTLPPNQFLPISTNAASGALNGIDGDFSAELACVSGWRAPEPWGVWADEPATTLRFRTVAPAGSQIHLVMRLAPPGRARRRLRISSGSGNEIEISLEGGSDTVAILSCEVEPDSLITAQMSLLDAGEGGARSPYWILKGILYFQPELLAPRAGKDAKTFEHSIASPTPAAQSDRPQASASEKLLRLAPLGSIEGSRRAASLPEFLQSTNSAWLEHSLPTYRDPPIFLDAADTETFFLHYRNSPRPPVGAISEHMALIRRSEQYVSTSRLSEGSVFDHRGVSKGLGYLLSAPADTSWLSRRAGEDLWASETSLAAAPRYDKSCLIFYNGNLHNYYHWLAEGLLSLDILAGAMAPAGNMSIALPKSVDVNAVFDHRDTLEALGFDGLDVVEVDAKLITVSEAIWVDSGDLVENLPAAYFQNFQRRIAAKYSGAAGSRTRRLLIGRKGPTRKIQNFDQVQSFLAVHGFETIFLEGASMKEQILLFQSAEFVVGAHGAGLANLLFCEPATKVIEFMPSVEMRPFFWLISEKLNLVHAVQFCATYGGDSFRASLEVDIKRLEALFRIVGG
jgi:glycosyltransferase involved in cell wall biosynthesis